MTHTRQNKTNQKLSSSVVPPSLASLDKKAKETEEKARKKTPNHGVYFADAPRTSFIKSLRIRTKDSDASKIGIHIASFLPPKERRKWDVFVNRVTSDYYLKQAYFYRNKWSSEAYNTIFMPLGAGYNDIDHRVSVFNATMINALACNYGGCCCNYGSPSTPCLGEQSCCWEKASPQDYVNNKAGIKFPDYVNESHVVTDCFSNFARSLLCLPCNTVFSTLECLFSYLPEAIFYPCSLDYSRYKSAPGCCNYIGPADNRMARKIGARYRGCEDRTYQYNGDVSCSCCAYSYNGKFLANDLCTNFSSMIGLPFLNVCCAAASCTFCYGTGTIADWMYPNKYQYVYGQNNAVPITVDDCILALTAEIPKASFLRKLRTNAGYFLNNATLCYFNLARGIGVALDLSPNEVQVFISELKPTNNPIVLTKQTLQRITAITGHSHCEMNKSNIRRNLDYQARMYGEEDEIAKRHQEQEKAYAAIKNKYSMSRNNEASVMPTLPGSIQINSDDKTQQKKSSPNTASFFTTQPPSTPNTTINANNKKSGTTTCTFSVTPTGI